MSGNGAAGLEPLLFVCLLLTSCTGGGTQNPGVAGAAGKQGLECRGDLYMQLAVEYLRQGQVEYLRQGQTETTLIKAEQALITDPDNSQPHSLVAMIYQRLGHDPLAADSRRPGCGIDRPWPTHAMSHPGSP